MLSPSDSYVRSAAHVEDLAGYVNRFIGTEVERWLSYFLGFDVPANGDAGAEVGEPRFGEVDEDRGVDQPGGDRVGGNARGRELDRERSDHPMRPFLGRANMRQ